MATIKVKRRGDDLELLLPAELVERLALHDGDELAVTEGPDGLVLRREPTLDERKRASFDRVLQTHARTFETLANR